MIKDGWWWHMTTAASEWTGDGGKGLQCQCSVSMPTKPPALDPLRSSTAASDERDRVREGDRHRESETQRHRESQRDRTESRLAVAVATVAAAAVVDDSSTCPTLPTPKAK